MSSENHSSDSATIRSMVITFSVIAGVMACLIIVSMNLGGS